MMHRLRSTLTMTIAAVAIGTLAVAVPSSASAADTGLVVTQLPAQVRLISGESFTLSLPTNVTTGYSWAAKVTGSTKAVKVSQGVYQAPASPDGMVGVPGRTVWTITGAKKGTATVTIVATPPGGGAGTSTDADGNLQAVTVIVMK